jgi:hypothetical protein
MRGLGSQIPDGPSLFRSHEIKGRPTDGAGSASSMEAEAEEKLPARDASRIINEWLDRPAGGLRMGASAMVAGGGNQHNTKPAFVRSGVAWKTSDASGTDTVTAEQQAQIARRDDEIRVLKMERASLQLEVCHMALTLAPSVVLAARTR